MGAEDPEPAETGVELEFRVPDRALFFVRASHDAQCTIRLAEMVHRSDGRLLEYFVVEGATTDRVLTAANAATAIDDARVIREEGTEALFEFIVSGLCIGGTLADAGAVVRDVLATDGVGRVVADVPPHTKAGRVISTVRQRHDVELLARRERDQPTPDFTSSEFRATLAARLTDRQLEAVRTAYASGYFTWPRQSTAEECAEALGITQPTFTQHLRTAEEKLLQALFDEPERDGTDLAQRGTRSVTPR